METQIESLLQTRMSSNRIMDKPKQDSPPESVILEDDDDTDDDIILDDDDADDDDNNKQSVGGVEPPKPANPVKQTLSSIMNGATSNANKIYHLQKLLAEWKEQNFDELLLVNDYLFEDPQIKNLRPHEAYAYTLGLNLALETACNTYKYMINKTKAKEAAQSTATATATTTPKPNAKTPTKPTNGQTYNLNIGITNEADFLKNLDANHDKVRTLNRAFNAASQSKHCRLCNFKSESNFVLDQHLTQPHNVNFNLKSTKSTREIQFMCGFCGDEKVYTKDDYAQHVYTVHRRVYSFEKPLGAYMCHICDYECTKKSRLAKHATQCNDNEAFKKAFLDKLQEPTLSDYLDYEFLFPSAETIEKNKKMHQQSNDIKFKTIQQMNTKNNLLVPKSPIVQNIHLKNKNENIKSILNPIRYTLPKQLPNTEPFKLNGYIPVKLPNGSIRLIHDENKTITPINNNTTANQRPTTAAIVQRHHINPLLNSTHNVNGATKVTAAQAPSSDFIPKFLICPICKNSIKNLIELTAHIQKVHNLDDKTTNLIINEKVIPQLSFAFTAVTKKPTVLQSHANRPHTMNDNRTQNVHPNNSMATTVQAVQRPQGPHTKLIDYDLEHKIIADFCRAHNLSETKFVEIKNFSGKCYMCPDKRFFDLSLHLKQQHHLDLNDVRFEQLCVLCGFKCTSRQSLLLHQFNTHKMIQYLSTDKLLSYQSNLKATVPFGAANNGVASVDAKKSSNLLLKITEIQNGAKGVKRNIESVVQAKPTGVQEQNATKTYTCSECSRKFEDFYIYCSHLIKAHQDTTHSQAIINCPICNEKFTKGSNYQSHIRTHLKSCKIELNRVGEQTDTDTDFDEICSSKRQADFVDELDEEFLPKRAKISKIDEVILLDD